MTNPVRKSLLALTVVAAGLAFANCKDRLIDAVASQVLYDQPPYNIRQIAKAIERSPQSKDLNLRFFTEWGRLIILVEFDLFRPSFSAIRAYSDIRRTLIFSDGLDLDEDGNWVEIPDVNIRVQRWYPTLRLTLRGMQGFVVSSAGLLTYAQLFMNGIPASTYGIAMGGAGLMAISFESLLRSLRANPPALPPGDAAALRSHAENVVDELVNDEVDFDRHTPLVLVVPPSLSPTVADVLEENSFTEIVPEP